MTFLILLVTTDTLTLRFFCIQRGVIKRRPLTIPSLQLSEVNQNSGPNVAVALADQETYGYG